MALNFSEFLDGFVDPQYHAEGKDPKCPKGSKWDKKLGVCVPSGKWTEGDKECPQDLAGYDVFGSDGMNGAPPAIAVEEEFVDETAVMSYQTKYDPKYQKRLADKAAEYKKKDERMKYGKSGKPTTQLRKGEVLTYNKETGEYESNKK